MRWRLFNSTIQQRKTDMMNEIAISYAGFACVCGVWFLIGLFVGSWVQERWGGDDANDGADEDECGRVCGGEA
jgi:hypothetical protein